MWSFTLTLYRTGPVCSMAVLVRDKRLQGAAGWAGAISSSLHRAYSDPTLSWHFNPEGAVLGWKRWFFVELIDMVTGPYQACVAVWSAVTPFLKLCTNFSAWPLVAWLVGCTHNMLNTISSCKFPERFWRELWSVVRHHMLRESQVGKQGAQCANSLLSSSVFHDKDLRLLAACLNHHH